MMEFVTARRFGLKAGRGLLVMACAVGALPAMAAAVTVTLSPNADSWVSKDNPTDTNGGSSSLEVRASSGTNLRRALVRFDLSTIPACATIDSATLRIRVSSAPGSSRTHNVHRMTSSWTEASVSWNNRTSGTPWTTAGGDFNPTFTAQATVSSTGYKTWNVQSDVAAFVALSATNNGWLVRDNAETSSNATTVYSSKEASVGNRPELVVSYTLNDTACNDSNVCTTDVCGGSGCQYTNNAATCRASAGACDTAEVFHFIAKESETR